MSEKLKLKNGEIFGTKDALNALLARTDISVKYGYPIAKLAKNLRVDLELIEQKRNELILKYGEKDEKTQQTSILPILSDGSANSKWAEFVKEHNELMAIETEVVFDKVKILDSWNIPGNNLLTLDSFIEVVVA